MRMLKILLLGLVLFGLIACEKEQKSEKPKVIEEKVLIEVDDNPHLFTAEDLYKVKRIEDPSISPDGKWVIFTLASPNIDENKVMRDIYAIKIDGTGLMRVTDHEASDYNAVWTQNGKGILFISSREDAPQIFRKDFPEGPVTRYSNSKMGTSNLLISPNGTNLLYTTSVKYFETVQDKYPKYDKANVMIFNDLPVRHWDSWEDEYKTNIMYKPINSGTAQNIMNEPFNSPLEPFGGKEQIAWSTNGDKIAYTSKKVDDYVWSTNSDIYIYDLQSEKTTNITSENKGYDRDPKFSKDSKWLAYLSQERPGFESDRVRLMAYNFETGTHTELTKTHDQWVNSFVWHPDGSKIYYSATDSGTVQLFEISVPGGEWRQISEGRFNYGSGLDISSDGSFLVFGRESMLNPVDLFKMSTTDFTTERITDINEQLFKNIKPAIVTERWIKSTDGKSIHCWVMMPPDFDSTRKYPMITYLQGGPQSMISQHFHYRWNWQLMASNGYIVLMPNRRGLPGFGQDWNDAISLDWGGMPMTDIIAATDELKKEPYVDENNLAALGASAGGYAAFWLAGHHEGRFNAFISHCGVFNLYSMYGSTEELFFPNWEYGGPYWDTKHKANYEKNSPHNYVQKWDTPILISTGMNDFRVPYTQSLEAFTAARAQGITAELIVFPEETHFIAHPQEFIIWNSEFFKFLDKYCK